MDYPERVTSTRVTLRPLRPDDAASLHANLISDPAVSLFLTWKPATSVQETSERLRSIIAESASGGERTWVITPRQDTVDEPIGMFTVWSTEQGQEIGYCLRPDAWGAGLMTETVTAVTATLLERPDVVRVWATCDVENTASVRVLEKAGFQREGLLRKCAVHPNISAGHRDCLLYAKVGEDEAAS